MYPQGEGFNASDLLSRSQSGRPSRLRIIILTVAALAVVLLAWCFWGGAGADHTFALEEGTGFDGEPGADDGIAGESIEYLWVHVSGAVNDPGVYQLEVGSRVNDALAKAGGFTEDAALNSVNLARILNDGEQIIFPTQEEVDSQTGSGESAWSAASGGASGSAPGTGGLVNINTAGSEELETLPGVGPATAAKIIADREANGPFMSTEDIKRVSGIGDAKYAQMAALICI